MRFNRRTDYGELSRQSIRREMNKEMSKYSTSDTQTKTNDVKRVISITDNSYYAKYRRYILDKLVRLLRISEFGNWEVEFVNESDRQALNNAAGWSDNKREYIFDGAKYD